MSVGFDTRHHQFENVCQRSNCSIQIIDVSMSVEMSYNPEDDVLVDDEDWLINIPSPAKFVPVLSDNEDPRFQPDSSDSDTDLDEEDNIFHWEEPSLDELPMDHDSVDTLSMFIDMGGTQLGSSYFDETLDHLDTTSPIFPGSPHSIQDFSRYMLAMKQALNVGDETFASMVGTMISFLPPSNELAKCLEEGPSTYKIKQVVTVTAALRPDLRTFQFNTCTKGCRTYGISEFFCSVCSESRHLYCTYKCYDEDNVCCCIHKKIPRQLLYYMPVRDRVAGLLNSDLKNMFYYNTFRKKTETDGYVEDVLDSPVYNKLRKEVPHGGIPIFIQICWDGALMFNAGKGESMWPLCYSIMNLPPCLRNKVHVGMHVATFCKGSTASLDVFAQELLDLWNHPIEVDGKMFYVMVSQIVMDGPGRAKYCKCQATTSLAGCNLCDVTGDLMSYVVYMLKYVENMSF